jgi:hypothetical protein
MADAGFAVDPAALGSTARPYHEVAAQVSALHQTLSAALDAIGPCWGDDEAGQQFASNYVPNKELTLDEFGRAAGALGSAAGGIGGWHHGYVSAESDIADGLA